VNLLSALNRSRNEVLPEFVLTVQVVNVAEAELQQKRNKVKQLFSAPAIFVVTARGALGVVP
jgi:hypothetical protein